jgi:hypothetical protein
LFAGAPNEVDAPEDQIDHGFDRPLRRLAQDRRVKGIDLARNFGQHYAITAGLDYARGDWVEDPEGGYFSDYDPATILFM